MNQDIITPNNQRGSVRPPERQDVPTSRPIEPRMQPRPASVSMDGMMSGGAHKSLIAPVQSAPQPQPARVQPIFQSQPRPTPPPPPQSLQPPVQPQATRTFQDFSQPKPVEPMRPQPSFDVTPVAQVAQQPLQPRPQSQVTPTPLAPVESEAPADTKSNEVKPPKPPKKPKSEKPRSIKKFVLIAVGVIILLVGGYIAYDTLVVNRQAQALLSPGDGDNSGKDHTKDAEGKDETVPPTNAFWDYKVGAEFPRALYIDKINVAARVMPMSINTDGSLQAPLNIFDSGWYTGSAKPGENGAAFIDGHASGATRAGLFAYLDTLAVGDKLRIEKGDGTMLNFKVVHVETVPLDEVDMQKALKPYGEATKGMNLMTCTGKWVDDKATYDHRVVVYTELVE